MIRRRKLISVVIPAYNEEANVGDTIAGVIKAIPINYDGEIIFVNDGSKDRTSFVTLNLNAWERGIK